MVDPVKRIGNTDGFTCLIPIVHPEGSRIQSYEEVEALLRTTLASMLSMAGPPAKIGIICHKVPDWAAQMPDNVRFLDLGPRPLLPPELNHVQIDKGLKYILGIIWAFSEGAPDFIMPCDGDDYLHRDLMIEVFANRHSLDGQDGFVVINGVHALLEWENRELNIAAAFNVSDFHLTCGTCRVFSAPELLEKVVAAAGNLRQLPKVWKTDENARTTHVGEAARETLVTSLAALFDEGRGVVRLLGRHAKQYPEFRLLPLQKNLVAKGCGHGNHDGKRGGDIHWHRITGILQNREFLKNYGLEEVIGISPKRNGTALINGYAGLARAAFRRLLSPFARQRHRHY